MTGTLLIADDSQGKIDLLRHVLHKANWDGEVVIARTTEEAMAMIDEHEIAFGFIDYYIPSQNGPAIMRYLKQAHPDARFVLVSSADNAANQAEAREAGAETCICTTYEADEVEKAVLDVIEGWVS